MTGFSMTLSKLADLAMVGQFILLFVVSIYAVRQLRESNRGRNLAAAKYMLFLLGNDHLRKKRHNFKAPDKLENIDSKQKEQVSEISRVFNRAGLLAKHKLIDERIMFEMYAETIVKTWNKLKGCIMHMRGESPPERYQHYFQKIADRAYKYLLKKQPKIAERIEDPRKGIIC